MESPFAHLLELLAKIEDPRRAEGKLYKLPHVMLFSILAMMAGANSYRGIHSFIEVHLERLRTHFGLSWRRAPAYTTIRIVLQGLDGARLSGHSACMVRSCEKARAGRACAWSPSMARPCAAATTTLPTRRPVTW